MKKIALCQKFHTLTFFLGKQAAASFTIFSAATNCRTLALLHGGTRELRAMLQDPANRDVFTAHRPSPWPYVGAMIGATALITTLLVAFGS